VISGLHRSIFIQPFSAQVYTPEFFYSPQYSIPAPLLKNRQRFGKKLGCSSYVTTLHLFLVEMSEIKAF
jgi:hypothetical protein